MSEKVTFGIDKSLISAIDWQLAVSRIIQDCKSDFVFAPHLNFIYAYAGEHLIGEVTSELKSGTYTTGVPIHIEVPKSGRMRTSGMNRLGPPFSRQGSILLPKDRLLYQAIADQASGIIEEKTDKTRSFSHRVAEGQDAMFVPTRQCWSEFQGRIRELSKKPGNNYVLKTDIANCFGTLNQHTLINTLNDAGFDTALNGRLETIITRYTGDRNSRGILQGLYPSDLLGNFYLNPIDRFLSDQGVDSARYVDDIYVFVATGDQAEKITRDLIKELRIYDLGINESKSKLMPSGLLLTDEPDLEELFQKAVEEASSQIEGHDGVDYGFQIAWDHLFDDETDDDETGSGTSNEPSLAETLLGQDTPELNLTATIALFNAAGNYPDQEENIERFCLPLFSKTGSDFAIDHVLESFSQRPSMAQIYCSYLSSFLDYEHVQNFLIDKLTDSALVDWQRIWVAAALLTLDSGGEEVVKPAWAIFQDANRHEALRANAAILVGRYGDIGRRKGLIDAYATCTPFLQSAIYYSSRAWPKTERQNVKNDWSKHHALNVLLTIAMENSAA